MAGASAPGRGRKCIKSRRDGGKIGNLMVCRRDTKRQSPEASCSTPGNRRPVAPALSDSVWHRIAAAETRRPALWQTLAGWIETSLSLRPRIFPRSRAAVRWSRRGHWHAEAEPPRPSPNGAPAMFRLWIHTRCPELSSHAALHEKTLAHYARGLIAAWSLHLHLPPCHFLAAFARTESRPSLPGFTNTASPTPSMPGRQMHEAYQPKCAEMWPPHRRANAKVQQLLSTTNTSTPEIKQALSGPPSFASNASRPLCSIFTKSAVHAAGPGQTYLAWVQQEPCSPADGPNQTGHENGSPLSPETSIRPIQYLSIQ